MNILLFLSWSILGLSSILLSYKYFGKIGLYGMIVGCVVMMNIVVTKSVVLFGLGATGGNIFYAMIFLSTDILSEKYGGKMARKGVMLGFFMSLVTMIGCWVTLLMIPAPWDVMHEHLSMVLTPIFRIVLGSLVAYLVSNLIDTYLYDVIKKKHPNKLWLRNNGSTAISQFIDTCIFISIAFIGTMPTGAIIQILLSTYLLKLLVSIIDTPFLYIAKQINYED